MKKMEVMQSGVSASTSVRREFLETCGLFGPHSIVFDCGSRDALDGIALANAVGASQLHVFEPNPRSAAQCRANSTQAPSNLNITVNECAIARESGSRTFFVNDPKLTQTDWVDGNQGASSLYSANPDYPFEKYAQVPISVEAITLDAYCQANGVWPDILWMDLQGAEVEAFEGGAVTVKRAKIIHLEVSFRPVYIGQPLFSAVKNMLSATHQLKRIFTGRWPALPTVYERLGFGPWFGDAVFVRRDLIK